MHFKGFLFPVFQKLLFPVFQRILISVFHRTLLPVFPRIKFPTFQRTAVPVFWRTLFLYFKEFHLSIVQRIISVSHYAYLLFYSSLQSLSHFPFIYSLICLSKYRFIYPHSTVNYLTLLSPSKYSSNFQPVSKYQFSYLCSNVYLSSPSQ